MSESKSSTREYLYLFVGLVVGAFIVFGVFKPLLFDKALMFLFSFAFYAIVGCLAVLAIFNKFVKPIDSEWNTTQTLILVISLSLIAIFSLVVAYEMSKDIHYDNNPYSEDIAYTPF